MKNYVQDGVTIDFPAPTGGVTSGDGVIIGNLFGVACSTASEGETVALTTVGVFELPKTLSASFTAGAAVSFVVATRSCAEPGTGAYPIGTATGAAGAGAAKVTVRLDGVATQAAS